MDIPKQEHEAWSNGWSFVVELTMIFRPFNGFSWHSTTDDGWLLYCTDVWWLGGDFSQPVRLYPYLYGVAFGFNIKVPYNSRSKRWLIVLASPNPRIQIIKMSICSFFLLFILILWVFRNSPNNFDFMNPSIDLVVFVVTLIDLLISSSTCLIFRGKKTVDC